MGSCACTQKGYGKKINQDALLLKVAVLNKGRIAFAVLCDGMGGLGDRSAGAADPATSRRLQVRPLPTLWPGAPLHREPVGKERTPEPEGARHDSDVQGSVPVARRKNICMPNPKPT